MIVTAPSDVNKVCVADTPKGQCVAPCLFTQIGATYECIDPCALHFTVSPLAYPLAEFPAIGGQNTTVVRTTADYTAFLLSGIVLIVIAACLGVAAIVLFVMDFVHFKHAVVGSNETINTSTATEGIDVLIRESLSSMKFYADSTRSKIKALSVLFSVIAFDILCVGIFLVIFYSTSSAYSSSHSALLEFYHTSVTSSSFFSPQPFSIAFVDPRSSKFCLQRQAVGIAPLQKLFISAICFNNQTTGDVYLMIKTGDSASSCQARPYSAFTSGQIILASRVLDFANAGDYLQLSCGDAGSVAARYYFFEQTQRRASGVLTKASIAAESTPPALLQHWDTTSSAGTSAFSYTRVASKAAETLLSSDPCRYESLTSNSASSPFAALSSSTISTMSLLIQISGDVFGDNSTPANTTVLQHRYFDPASLSSQNIEAKWNAIPGNITLLGPADGDLPIGFVQSSYSVSNGPLGKYYGVVRSFSDVGRYFGLETAEKDGTGVTVSFYLTATSMTTGFAFAVTDARENMFTGFSPLLDQLTSMMKQGSDSSSWFGKGANVYLGLYVDGPGATLHLVMANSIQDANGRALSFAAQDVFVDIAWDLRSLGLSRLLNGAWHQVAVVLRSENAQTKAQLIVDGQTSTTKAPWNICVPRKPVAIFDYKGMQVPGSSAVEERVRSNGVLYTGQMTSGGVSKIQFFPGVRDIFDMWLTSTPAIRDFNAINSTRYVVLGAILLVAGFAFFVVLWATSGREILSVEGELADWNKTRSFNLYGTLWSSKPRDSAGVQFQPISWGAAKHILGLDNEALFAFLGELVIIQPIPHEELVRLLYLSMSPDLTEKKKSFSAPLPSADEWETRAVAGSQKLNVEPDPEDITSLVAASKYADVRRKSLADRGENAVVIDSGQLFFGGNQEVATQTGDQSVYVVGGSEIKQLVMPVLTVLQSLYVWLSTISIPFEYRVNFGSFFSVVCADLTAAFAQVPPLATPLAQLFLGMFAVSALFYFLHKDEQAFLSYVGTYALRRDSPLTSSPHDEDSINVDVLSVRAAQQVDRMLGRVEAISTSNDTTDEKITVPILSGSAELVLKKTAVEESKFEATVINCPDDQHAVLEDVGCMCIRHTERHLHSQFQTDVWPFDQRPACCLSVDGKLCGTSKGNMYVCGLREPGTTEVKSASSECNFALCEKHMRTDGLGLLRADFLSLSRSLSTNGPLLFMTVAMFLCNAFYMPVLKTSLMILGCHPYFQCLFPTCWSPVDRNYALAVFLSLVIVFFFGLGFPIVLSMLLHRRSTCIGQIFFAPCYMGKYGTQHRNVKLSEWLRFSSTDPTALGTLYKTFELEWIYLPPILLAWKVVLLIPPVFAESGSFEQSIGLAIVEFCYGLFLFVTQPALAPMTDLMYKLGAVHQMIFLGLQNLDTYARYHHGTSGSFSASLVGTTLGYLLVCVLCIIWSKIAPVIQSTRRRTRIGQLLEELGMQYSANTSLYRMPKQTRTESAPSNKPRHTESVTNCVIDF